MENKVVTDKLYEAEALLDGHFLLSSGRHGGKYCQCAKLFIRPELAAAVIAETAKALQGVEFDIIAGPAMGGILPAYELSRQTGKPNVFVERENNIMTLRRGFAIEPGAKVLIMEDVITTGKSTQEAAEVIRELGGIVIGAGCIVNRCTGELPFPVYSATTLAIPNYEPESCPLCAEGLPIVKPGSRKQ